MSRNDMALEIRQVSWPEQQVAIAAIRREVFIEEQHVPEELEWDGEDENAIHLLAILDKQPVGTARMLADGHIGRMSVLKAHRHLGIGRALLVAMLDIARMQGHREVDLDAQIRALGFYERLGFRAQGEVFMDAGIPHRHMTLSL